MRHRAFDGRDADAGMGRPISRAGGAADPGRRRRAAGRAVFHRRDRHVGDADPDGPPLEGRRLFRRSRAGRGIAAVVEDRDRDGARAGLGAKSVRPQLDQAGRRSTRGRREYVQRREHARCRRVAARPLRRCRASGASGARLPHLRCRSGRFGQSDPRADAVDCGAHRRSHVPGLFAAGGGAIAGARDAGAVGGNRHRRRPFGLLVRDCPRRSADRGLSRGR